MPNPQDGLIQSGLSGIQAAGRANLAKAMATPEGQPVPTPGPPAAQPEVTPPPAGDGAPTAEPPATPPHMRPAEPEPQPEATPTPEPEPGQEPPAEPAAEEPAVPIDETKLSETARKALEYEGWKPGDPLTLAELNKVLERYMEFNNRLGNKGQQQDGSGEGTEEEPPLDEPDIPPPNPEQLRQHVVASMRQDAEAQVWVQNWREAGEKVQKHDSSIVEMQRSIDRENLRLELPEIAKDESGISQSEIKEKIRELRADIREAKQERLDAQAEMQHLDGEYAEREQYYAEQITAQYEQQQMDAHRQQRIDGFVKRMEQEWPVALQRVAKDHGFDAEGLKILEKRGERAVFAHTADGTPVDNVEALLDTEAKAIKQEWDYAHRQKSAEYARAAGQRSDTPAAPPQPAGEAPAPTPQSKGPNELTDIYSRTRLNLRRAMSGR